MAKTYSWSTNQEELRRMFILTLNDHRFLLSLRADAQRLYCALVLVWARAERVLLSEANGIPDEVIHHVSKQLKVTPYLFVNAEPMLAVLSGENGGQKCWEPVYELFYTVLPTAHSCRRSHTMARSVRFLA
jgi:hypothetical protein